MSEKISLIHATKILGIGYRNAVHRVNKGLPMPFHVKIVEPILGKGMGRRHYFCDLAEIKNFCLESGLPFKEEI